MYLTLLLEWLFGSIFRRTLRLPALSPAQRWAIAAGANLARLNGSSLASVHTTKLPLWNRFILRRWWGVAGAQRLRETMTWLEEEGHRTEFREIHRLLAPVAAGRATIDPEANTATLRFIVDHHGRFKNGDLVAWDFARLINVARFGFSAGYLPEVDAWQIITRAARRLASEYDSWQELSDNYVLGLRYWQDGAQPDPFFLEAATWLASDPASPWRTVPWSARPL